MAITSGGVGAGHDARIGAIASMACRKTKCAASSEAAREEHSMRAADGVNAARHRPLLESRAQDCVAWKTER